MGKVGQWREIRVGELGQVFTGRTPATEFPGYFGGDFPFITPGDMRQGIFARKSERSLSQEGAETLKRIRLPAGTVCVSCIGWQMGEVIMTDRPSFTNQQINSIVPNGSVEPAFLYYSFVPRKQELLSLGAASGVRTPILNKSAFCDLKFRLPPLPTQRRIAGVLSAYDELIENNQRRIRILETMARDLYREWFVEFRFPGHESHPRVASALGEIPAGWEVRKLGDVAEDVRRNVPKGALAEPTRFVGLEHIPRRSLALDAWETTQELGSNKLEFKKGEVLFGKIRPYFHKVCVAPFDGLCSADTIVIRARHPNEHAFVVSCVSSDAFVAHASATANGVKMPRASWDVLAKYELLIPRGRMAEAFSRTFSDLIDQQQVLISQTQTLRRTRDLLLPRLLSGQVALEVD
jgi:type I restriction enzyme, S subunit